MQWTHSIQMLKISSLMKKLLNISIKQISLIRYIILEIQQILESHDLNEHNLF